MSNVLAGDVSVSTLSPGAANITTDATLGATRDRIEYAGARNGKRRAIDTSRQRARGHPNGGLIVDLIKQPSCGDLGRRSEAQEARLKGFAANIPIRETGRAVDIANAMLYLASDDSVYVTGQEIAVDGGYLCQ